LQIEEVEEEIRGCESRLDTIERTLRISTVPDSERCSEVILSIMIFHGNKCFSTNIDILIIKEIISYVIHGNINL